MLCKECGFGIHESWEFDYHPNCWPEFEPMPGMFGMTPYDLGIKDDLINVVNWSSKNARRSLQVALGCSEVGQDCTRRLAYKMAGIPEVNVGTDPWPAVVGTSIHSYMEKAINDYQGVHSMAQWLTELTVVPSPLVRGHSDLLDVKRNLVLDWKFPSADNIRAMRKEGPSAQYVTQVQLYGLGHVMSGRTIERVGIVALGRQGWLKDMYVWTTVFDQQSAEASLQRVYDLGNKMIEVDIMNHPDLWSDIPATPSRLCSYCPYYRRGIVTDNKGCSGI